MKYLVLCPCAHPLDRHGAEGCGGDGIMPCPCPNSEDGALEAAIDGARLRPWEGAQVPAEVA